MILIALFNQNWSVFKNMWSWNIRKTKNILKSEKSQFFLLSKIFLFVEFLRFGILFDMGYFWWGIFRKILLYGILWLFVRYVTLMPDALRFWNNPCLVWIRCFSHFQTNLIVCRIHSKTFDWDIATCINLGNLLKSWSLGTEFPKYFWVDLREQLWQLWSPSFDTIAESWKRSLSSKDWMSRTKKGVQSSCGHPP